MRVRVFVVAAAMAVNLALPATALAGVEWCEVDPILEFADGSQVQWATGFAVRDLGTLAGPVDLTVEVPANAGPIRIAFPASPAQERVHVDYTGAAWNGAGPMPVRVTVLVSASRTFKTVTTVRGNVAKERSVDGRSNVPTQANARLDPTPPSTIVGGTALWTMTVSADATVTGP